LAEYEGILSWAVEGFKRWQAEGLGSCAEIDKATLEYREESDVLRDFISERCVINADLSVNSTAICKVLSEWCKDNGLYKISRSKLIEYLESKGFEKKRQTAGLEKGTFAWFGISLKTSEEISPEFLHSGSFEPDERPY
jgi:putative DNA primase/helicase